MTNVNRNEPLGRVLSYIGKHYLEVIGSELSHLEIDRYYYVLLVIDENKSKASQQLIANLIGQSKTAMVRIVDYLVEKEYVVRKVNMADKREYTLELTNKAQLVIDDIQKSFKKVNAEAFKGMDALQIKQFYESLDLINTNLLSLPSVEYKIDYKKTKKK